MTFPYSNDQSRSDGSIPVIDATPSFLRISAAGSYLIKPGLGQIGLIITSVAGLTITLYDGISAAGSQICAITPSAGSSLPIKTQCVTGIFAVAAGTGDLTLTFR